MILPAQHFKGHEQQEYLESTGKKERFNSMALVRRRKRVLVQAPDRSKTTFQPQIDHIMLIMAHPLRVATLEFLNRARKMGEALQPFSNIQHALESKNKRLSTSDLDYHLKELKKAAFIEQMSNGERSAGYLLTEKGRKIVELYFEMKDIHIEVPELEPNILEEHVYVHRILSLTKPVKDESHVIDIKLESRSGESNYDKYLVSQSREIVVKKQRDPKAKIKEKHDHEASKVGPRAESKNQKTPIKKDKSAGFSSLDSFR